MCINLFRPSQRVDRRRWISKATTSVQCSIIWVYDGTFLHRFFGFLFVDFLLAIVCKWADKLSNEKVKFKVFTFIVDFFTILNVNAAILWHESIRNGEMPLLSWIIIKEISFSIWGFGEKICKANSVVFLNTL